ncbi:MAG: ATP-binding protein, partial [Kiritimatiellae bacterium]|nr:ATP-binding protein [Kiritimatiellia bacterium]
NAAERMLLSCRTELKRCLWDLRNDALDVRNMSDAIQKALAPVKGNAILSVRFNVIRSNLDESTFHAVIRIVRELVSNAIQHGRASHVCVAGDLAGDALSFSVKDDGTGFDVATAPGPADGHFGLAGVSERVKRHNGRVQVESSPGKGTKINVKLQVKN